MSGYLRSLAFFVVLILLLLAGFNVLSNPYGYFDVPQVRGINQFPLGFNHRLPLAKALTIHRLKPVAAIAGNSRAETGYDPVHTVFSESPAYNLSIGGANIQTAKAYLQEAAAGGRLRRIVLALDFTMFDPSLWKESPGNEVLLTDDEGKSRGAWHQTKRWATVLFSGTAVADSWWSLTHQRKPVAHYLPSGLRDDTSDLAQVMREGGHRNASLLTESAFMAAALGDLGSAGGQDKYHRGLRELGKIITMARDRNIRLSLVFNPIHARQNYLLQSAGLWPAYEQWKTDVAVLAANAPDVALWDFSAVSICTAEPLPGSGDTVSRMRWYRETSHFRPALGSKVLDRIGGKAADTECPDFGVRLTRDGLPKILASQRDALSEWINRNPQDVAEIDALAVRFGRRRP